MDKLVVLGWTFRCMLVWRSKGYRPRSVLSSKVMLVSELTDGIEISQVLRVRASERRVRRDGGEYLRLRLGDRTGTVVSTVWEDLLETECLARPGTLVYVTGRYIVHPRFGPQINLRSLGSAVRASFDRIEKEPSPGLRWSSFDCAIGAGAWFDERERSGPSEESAREAA